MLSHHSQNRGENMQQIPKHTRLQGINTSCSTQATFPTNLGNLMAKKSFNNSSFHPFANLCGMTGGFQPYVANRCRNLIQGHLPIPHLEFGMETSITGVVP